MQELAGLQLADAGLSVWKAHIWESAALPTEPLEEWHEWKIMQPDRKKTSKSHSNALSNLTPPPKTPCLIPKRSAAGVSFASWTKPHLVHRSGVRKAPPRQPYDGRYQISPSTSQFTSRLKAQPTPVLSHLRVSALCLYAADPSQPPRERYLGSTLLKQ